MPRQSQQADALAGWENEGGHTSHRSTQRTANMGARPLRNLVIARRIDIVEQVDGGIIVPDSARDKPQEADVVAVGPGKLNDAGCRLPLSIKQGDRILIAKHSGSEINIDGKSHLILCEDEILGVISAGR